jgi:hypothetical protein
MVVELMTKFQNDFKIFEDSYNKVKESRIIEFRNKIYSEVDEFFQTIRKYVDQQ